MSVGRVSTIPIDFNKPSPADFSANHSSKYSPASSSGWFCQSCGSEFGADYNPFFFNILRPSEIVFPDKVSDPGVIKLCRNCFDEKLSSLPK